MANNHSVEFAKDRRFWHRAAQASIGLWLSAGLAFVTTIVVARGLGPSDYGLVLQAIAAVALAAQFLDVPLQDALVRYGSLRLAERDYTGLQTLVRKALTVDVLVGICVASVLIATAPLVASLVGGHELPASLIALATLSVLGRTVDGTTSAVLLLARRPNVLGWVNGSGAGITLLAVALAASVGPAWTVAAYGIGAVSRGVAGLFAAWWYGWRKWSSVGQTSGRDSESLTQLMAFGFHSGVAGTTVAAESGLILILVGRISGPAEVAMLSAATFPLQGVGLLTSGFRTALFPEQANLAAANSYASLRRVIRYYSIVGLSVGIAGATAGWFIMPGLIPFLYSADYSASVGPARVLLLGAAVRLAFGWDKKFAAAIGRPELNTLVMLATLALKVVVVLALADSGALGASVAISIGMLLGALIWWRLSERLLRELSVEVGRSQPRNER